MIKRFFDITFSVFGLILLSPILFIALFLIWKTDKRNPLYITKRLGKNEKLFNMIKLRSMIENADVTGVFSSGNSDKRITPIGKKIRKYKLDEFMQLWNVLLGHMSLVGPRPNVKEETDLYTMEEKKLLTVKPGITDFSSIVFADEGNILEDVDNPDLTYNQLIRPWKSRLGLVYIENSSIILDIKIIVFTIIGIFFRKKALLWISNQLKIMKADEKLIKISKREAKLYAFPPPGADKIVKER